MGQGLLVVISGPSGAGKGTLGNKLRQELAGLKFSVSATTRRPRAGESDGRNYLFIDREKFQEMVANSELLEWAEVYGNFYGTPRRPIEESLARGEDVLLEIDIQGAMQIKKKFPAGVFIFILPPSYKELEKRIVRRGTEHPEEVARRLGAALTEISYISQYDYAVINDHVSEALEKLKAILIAEKCRPARWGPASVVRWAEEDVRETTI